MKMSPLPEGFDDGLWNSGSFWVMIVSTADFLMRSDS